MFKLQRKIYLDNNATTELSPAVRKKMLSVMKQHFGNPSSQYQKGREAAAIIDEARTRVAQAIGADAEHIIFTGSATEANNQVIHALCEHRTPGRYKILTTPIEHSSVLRALEHVKQHQPFQPPQHGTAPGIDVIRLPVDPYGRVDLDALAQTLDEHTLLLCCMLANNEIGTVQDITRVCQLAHATGTPVLVDCVQALGKIPIEVKTMGADFATFSAHKLHGPKGIGALYFADAANITPYIHGGHQENGLRAGTESVHNIAGFGEACLAVPHLLSTVQDLQDKKQRLLTGLREIKPDLIDRTHPDHCLPNTLSVSFPGFTNAVLLAALDFAGISVSAGSACNAGGSQPSHVLTAIGLSAEDADSTLRLSLSAHTHEREITAALKAFAPILQGTAPDIRLLQASRADHDFLFDPENYLLDIRFAYERALLKSMPNAHEVPLLQFKRYQGHLPKDKNIVIICMGGIDAMGLAYRLQDQGYKSLSVVIGGLAAWRWVHAELYKQWAGVNVERPAPLS